MDCGDGGHGVVGLLVVCFFFSGLAAGLKTFGRLELAGLRSALRDVTLCGGGWQWVDLECAAGTVTARAEFRCCDAIENLVSTAVFCTAVAYYTVFNEYSMQNLNAGLILETRLGKTGIRQLRALSRVTHLFALRRVQS